MKALRLLTNKKKAQVSSASQPFFGYTAEGETSLTLRGALSYQLVTNWLRQHDWAAVRLEGWRLTWTPDPSYGIHPNVSMAFC